MLGDVIHYIDRITKSIYKRLLNNEIVKEALEAYRAKRVYKKSYSISAILVGILDDNKEYNEELPSFNYVLANDLRVFNEYLARSTNELYKDIAEIDMSAMNIAYIIVLSIWIYIILRARRGTHTVLIDKGVEANLIS